MMRLCMLLTPENDLETPSLGDSTGSVRPIFIHTISTIEYCCAASRGRGTTKATICDLPRGWEVGGYRRWFKVIET